MDKATYEKLTPMMQHYLDTKDAYGDCFLFLSS